MQRRLRNTIPAWAAASLQQFCTVEVGQASLMNSYLCPNCQPLILYLAKLALKNEGKIENFSGKQKLSLSLSHTGGTSAKCTLVGKKMISDGRSKMQKGVNNNKINTRLGKSKYILIAYITLIISTLQCKKLR